MKNKKIFFILILCGLALTLLPSVASAARYECWCRKGGTDTMQYSYGSQGECQASCTVAPGLRCAGYESGYCYEKASSPTPSSGGQTAGKLTNPIKAKDFQTLIGQVINAILGVVGSIALLMFIYGGFLWLTSAGAEQKITQGKQIITWATIGLAVIFLSYTLVSFVIKGITTGGTPGGGSGDGGGGGPTGYCKCQNAEENAWMTQDLCDTTRCTWGLREASYGCCVVGGGNCFAGTDPDCTKAKGFFNSETACDSISLCSGATQKGCCITGSGVCQDNTEESLCQAMGAKSFNPGKKCVAIGAVTVCGQ